MNQILTDEEIGCIGHYVVTNAHTLDYFARAIEQAILNKLNSAEPVRPDWYQNPTSEQWFESPDDAQILEDLDSITVGDVIELDVCWNGTQMFRVTKLADETSDDVEFELIESSNKFYLHPPAPSVPEGYQLVPIEPTDKMIADGRLLGDVSYGDIYKAMLSACRVMK